MDNSCSAPDSVAAWTGRLDRRGFNPCAAGDSHHRDTAQNHPGTQCGLVCLARSEQKRELEYATNNV